MRVLRYLALLAVLTVPAAFAHSQVAVGIGIGPVVDYPAPVYVGGPPVCAWGYYSYYPYACAPYGYYGPDWFFGGIFIGAGPWYSGWYGRPWGWGWGHPWGGWGWGGHTYYGGGYGYRGGYSTFGNGYRTGGAYGRSPLNGGSRTIGMNGYRGTYNGFNGSSGFRSGYNGYSGFHGYSGSSGFHGYSGGSTVHSFGGGGFHGGGGFSGGFHGGGGGGFHGGGGGHR